MRYIFSYFSKEFVMNYCGRFEYSSSVPAEIVFNKIIALFFPPEAEETREIKKYFLYFSKFGAI